MGRFTSDIARELLQRDLEADARWVLEHLSTRTAELSTHDGRWFTRQVLPFKTANRRIEGVVVTLLDITALKETSELLTVREGQQRVIAQLGLAALSENDLQGFMDSTTRKLKETLGLDHCKILELQPGANRLLLRAGVGWNEGLVGSGWVDSGIDSQTGYTLSVPTPVIVEDMATETRFSGPPLLTDHGVVSGLSCAIRVGTQVYGVFGGHTRDKRMFNEEDTNFLQAAANIVGSTINHHEDRLRQKLDSAVARAIIERRDADATLAAVQLALLIEFGCDVSELWWADEQGDFSCRQVHTLPNERQQQIKHYLAERDISGADDLVLQVQARHQAVWATDIGQPGLFAGDEGARDFDFTTAFALPVTMGDQLVGVLILYARRRLFAMICHGWHFGHAGHPRVHA